MRRYRIVDPDFVVLPLSDGDTITVKKELNAGEEREVYVLQMATASIGDDGVKADMRMIGKALAVTYVVGWNLVDKEQKPLLYSPSALVSVDIETFNEIRLAVEAHHEAVERQRVERKKIRDGESSSPAISPSVV